MCVCVYIYIYIYIKNCNNISIYALYFPNKDCLAQFAERMSPCLVIVGLSPTFAYILTYQNKISSTAKQHRFVPNNQI